MIILENQQSFTEWIYTETTVKSFVNFNVKNTGQLKKKKSLPNTTNKKGNIAIISSTH